MYFYYAWLADLGLYETVKIVLSNKGIFDYSSQKEEMEQHKMHSSYLRYYVSWLAALGLYETANILYISSIYKKQTRENI